MYEQTGTLSYLLHWQSSAASALSRGRKWTQQPAEFWGETDNSASKNRYFLIWSIMIFTIVRLSLSPIIPIKILYSRLQLAVNSWLYVLPDLSSTV